MAKNKDDLALERRAEEQEPSEGPKPSVVSVGASMVQKVERINTFRGRAMVLDRHPYPHFRPLHKDHFEKIIYPILGGISRSRVNDIFAFVSAVAEDLTGFEDLVLFGRENVVDDDFYHEGAETKLWDMNALEWVKDPGLQAQAVWRSPYGVVKPSGPVPFIMSLAGDDEGLYDDIMQSLAPLVMARKPDGVIWWVGDGANGKSTLMDAIYRIFPGQLSSLTVKRLTDQRDTPSLNGTLANVVKESSEGRIEDTEIYKAIGTHENFRVHKFHSQDDIEIRGNMHHIFSGNSIPTFNDKGFSARRRTFIVPFTQQFKSDPSFEQRTFTPEMFGHLIYEMCRYAKQLRKQQYRYKWSAVTLGAKAAYDTDANNAEEYAKHIISEGVVAFDSFSPMKMDYENWCADNGYVPLGITNLRRALSALNFDRVSFRTVVNGAEHVRKMYRLPDINNVDLTTMGMNRPGMYTTPGFRAEQPKPDVPDFEHPVEFEPEVPTDTTTTTVKSILKGKW